MQMTSSHLSSALNANSPQILFAVDAEQVLEWHVQLGALPHVNAIPNGLVS